MAPTVPLAVSVAIRPKRIRSYAPSRSSAARAVAIARPSTGTSSAFSCTARVAPIASAFRSVSCTPSGPMQMAATSPEPARSICWRPTSSA